MTLTTIEYGSLASSETLNNNFSYLDDKITDSNESITSSISSILSNIATINSRITELSTSLGSSLTTLDTKVEGYRVKTKSLVAKAVMVPDWTSCTSITLSSSVAYTAGNNGYILIIPAASSTGNIVINNKTIPFKNMTFYYDASAQLVSIPVFKNDSVLCSAEISSSYFLPAKQVSVENF